MNELRTHCQPVDRTRDRSCSKLKGPIKDVVILELVLVMMS